MFRAAASLAVLAACGFPVSGVSVAWAQGTQRIDLRGVQTDAIEFPSRTERVLARAEGVYWRSSHGVLIDPALSRTAARTGDRWVEARSVRDGAGARVFARVTEGMEVRPGDVVEIDVVASDAVARSSRGFSAEGPVVASRVLAVIGRRDAGPGRAYVGGVPREASTPSCCPGELAYAQ